MKRRSLTVLGTIVAAIAVPHELWAANGSDPAVAPPPPPPPAPPTLFVGFRPVLKGPACFGEPDPVAVLPVWPVEFANGFIAPTDALSTTPASARAPSKSAPAAASSKSAPAAASSKSAPGPSITDREEVLRLKLEGRVLERMLGDLALGWNSKGHPAASLKKAGFTEMPAATDTWATSPPLPPGASSRELRRYSVPSDHIRPAPVAALEATPPDGSAPDLAPGLAPGPASRPGSHPWIGEDGQGAIFSRVSWKRPPELEPPPPVVVLRGRFAERLAFNGTRHDFQIMNSDPVSSAPFREEMFPFSAPARETGLEPFAELSPGSLPVDPANEGSARELASEHARKFFQLVDEQLFRFAIPAYLPTHIQVLGALNAMRSPPGRWDDLPVVTLDDAVVASAGQLSSLKEPPPPPAPSIGSLNYEVLPRPVAREALLLQARDREERVAQCLSVQARAIFPELIRKDWAQLPLSGFSPPEIESWVKQVGAPGHQQQLLEHFHQGALEYVVKYLLDDKARKVAGDGQCPDPNNQPPRATAARQALERKIFLQHVDYAATQALDPTPGARIKPSAHAAVTEKQWVAVLGEHGLLSQPMEPAGSLEVFPTAICTRGRGRPALDEKVTGPIHVDLLFALPDSERPASPAQALWQARRKLPFVMLDDPLAPAAASRVYEVADLGGAHLYLARWNVWTGWHLLWNVTGTPGGEQLELETAAICDDMTLATEEVVPSLVRKVLLEECEFAPAALDPGDEVQNAGAISSSGLAAGQEDAIPACSPKAAGTDADQLELRYLRGELRSAVHAALRAVGDPTRGLLIAAVDTTRQCREPASPSALPRSPYRVKLAHLRSEETSEFEYLLARGWMTYLPSKPTDPVVLVAPGYRAAPVRRLPTWEELKAFQVRQTQVRYLRRTRLMIWTSQGLEGGVRLGPVRKPLGELEINAGTTLWFWDHPRLAIDLGVTMHLEPIFVPTVADPKATFTLVPAVGPVAGIRFAPGPRLRRGVGDTPAWGAARPDGLARVSRFQCGIREHLLKGKAPEGPFILLRTALWANWSIPARTGPRASFDPYAPWLLLGPVLSVQYDLVSHGFDLQLGPVLQMSF